MLTQAKCPGAHGRKGLHEVAASSHEDTEALLGERKSGIIRPSSTASTASTCPSDEEEEDRDPLEAGQNFSRHVFEGLYGEDLRLRLDGHVLPQPACNRAGSGAMRLWTGAHRLKKPCGRCEDAFFQGSHAMGVADGVGSMVQFAKYGADAAAYAAELMRLADAALRHGAPGALADGPMPPEERSAAAMAAAEREATTYGASTITVLTLEGDRVGVANLGDSGFMLLRKASDGVNIVARSVEQQHHWNCPYQLARLPPALQARLQKGQRLDTAADCQRYSVPVQPGDLLLLFTDGLCDNVHDHELLQIVGRALAPAFGELAGLGRFSTPPERVARALALAAQERSLNTRATVPFTEASRRHGVECLGGKPDDITVVAAWVMPEAAAA